LRAARSSDIEGNATGKPPGVNPGPLRDGIEIAAESA
jgi:hypothetical protein